MNNNKQMPLTRQELLILWLKRQGKCQADIARALNVAEISVSRWVRADRISTRRHKQLVEFGIPADLLPVPLDLDPGRKKIIRSKTITPDNQNLPALPH